MKMLHMVSCRAVLLCLLLVAVASAEESPWLTNTPRPNPVTGPTSEQLNAAIRRGVDYLLADQNENGSWGSVTRTKNLNIYAPIPGAHHAFRGAVTGLCVSALIQSGHASSEVDAAIERGENWLREHAPSVRRANHDAIYNVWGHAYMIEALVDLLGWGDPSEERARQLRQLISDQVELLGRYESVDGGWGYYDFRAHAQQPSSNPTSFTTATALVALKRARDVGVDVPQRLIDRGIESILRQQKPDFSYYYSFGGITTAQPMRSINRPGGSLGRSQACNFALRLWGDRQITDEVLNVWLDRLFARNLWLDIGRKRPIPHESHFLVAGYFYYYGHWYAARTFPLLAEADRERHQAQMGHLLLDLQEKDGTWWDYPFYNYHQQYGTAMAVMSLAHCRPPEDKGTVETEH